MIDTAARDEVDGIMQRASAALVAMDYLGCEALCVEALGVARAAGAWDAYARVLLPLQEARRQRRMTALDGGVWLDQTDRADRVVVLTGVDRAGAAVVEAAARAARLMAEVLWVSDRSGDGWTVSTHVGPALSVLRPVPVDGHPDAAWAVAASEALGDAAIASVDAVGGAAMGSVERVERLEAMLDAVADHEKLHQRLADAARAVAAVAAARAGG